MWIFILILSVFAIAAIVVARLVSAPPSEDAEVANPQDQPDMTDLDEQH